MTAYFNELSLPVFHIDTDAIQRFREFGDFYKKARDFGIRDIKVPSNLYEHQFAPGYTIFNWFEDNRADEDLRTLFKSVFGTLPYVNDLLHDYQIKLDRPLTCTINGKSCVGLALASDKIFDSICFSMDLLSWTDPIYSIDIEVVYEDEHGNIASKIENGGAKHISSLAHADQHRTFIVDKVSSTIESGRYLWEHRESLFPNLQFCSNVRSLLAGYDANNIAFRNIISRLYDLQNVAANMNGHPITPDHFPTLTSPESNSRENKFGAQLSFECPDGVRRLFTWHSRFTPGAGRIHFVAFEDQNIIIIGYIGNKIQ